MQEWVQDHVILASVDCVTDKDVLWNAYQAMNTDAKEHDRELFLTFLGTALQTSALWKTGHVRVVKFRKRSKGYRGIAIRGLNVYDTKKTQKTTERDSKKVSINNADDTQLKEGEVIYRSTDEDASNDKVESASEFDDSICVDEETILEDRGIDDHFPAFPGLSPLSECDGGFQDEFRDKNIGDDNSSPPSSQVPDENDEVRVISPSSVKGNAMSFYTQHFRKLKSLRPSFLPGKPHSFNDFLTKVMPESAQKEIPFSEAGPSSSVPVARTRAFLAASFPPVTVGDLAASVVPGAEEGKPFPQFTNTSGSDILCTVCLPHQKWAKSNLQPHHQLKSKQASAQALLDGTAILQFSGVVQTEEHSKSKYHQEALAFFVKEKRMFEQKTGKEKKTKVAQQQFISNFFPSLN